MKKVLFVGLYLAAAMWSQAALGSWTADNGNGTFSNPLFYEDFPDPSMIRVGEDYYLTTTTNQCMPGLPIFHSKDLVNWEFLTYAFDTIDLSPEFRLEGDEIYSQGIWAPSLRYKDGKYYIFSNINGYGTQVYRSDSPTGPWKHNWLKTTLYDLSVLFDDDGKIYAVHSYDEVKLSQLNPELTDVVPGTEKVIIPRGSGMGEGLHVYKINGWYYIITALPGAHTPMRCARSRNIEGPYEIETISEKESMGIGLSYRLRDHGGGKFEIAPKDVNHAGGLTLHQGGIIDTQSGQWWGYSMMDHNGIGRMTCLSPVTWKNDWPYFGLENNLTRTPRVWVKPDTGFLQQPKPLFERSDDFSGEKFNDIWQWNHVPVADKWSMSERPGFLRLHAMGANDFWWARNSLTQRAAGPESTGTAVLETSGMAVGDTAGVALLSYPFYWVGVEKTESGLLTSQYDQFHAKKLTVATDKDRIWLRAKCNFDLDIASMSYSTDGRYFTGIGDEIKLAFQLRTFQGIRYCLFCYNADGKDGGYADFDSFTVDEPRDRGLTRAIPYGRKITLSSLADGKKAGVINGTVCATFLGMEFTVIDMGQGRIALQDSSGGYVSVSGKGKAGEVVIVKRKPSTPETFQWVDMQRDDLMLMSLATNRFLQITQAESAPANADIRTPRPDRLDGSVFSWKESQ